MENSLPDSGYVGIGTLTPESQLDVQGETRLDGPVTVYGTMHVLDSTIIDTTLQVHGTFKAFEKAVFAAPVRINDKLRVEGLSWMNGGMKVNGLPYFSTSDSMPEFQFMLIKPDNGIVKQISFQELRNGMYKAVGDPIGIEVCPPTEIASPYWVATPGKLFPNCPEIFVGVGTTNPLYKLDVLGSTRLTGNVGIAMNPNNQAQLRIKNDNRPAGIALYNEHIVDNRYGLRIYVNRNLTRAIGVTGIDGIKDVFRVLGNGTVYAKEIFVLPIAEFPDYVFESDYKLMPLPELSSFISLNNGLPNMPSADFVAKNGLQLGEMQRLMVEKIEELTLYVIGLNEENVKLNTSNDILQNENAVLRSEFDALKSEVEQIKQLISEN